MKTFPKYTNECNVNNYLMSNEMDYFICSKKFTNIDTSFMVIKNQKSSYLFVYKK